MQDRFKFRAVLKTDRFAIIVPVDTVFETGYQIDTNIAKEIFEDKYQDNCFFSDFLEIIEKQEYISQYSFDCDLLITKDFTNLIQCTGSKDKNGKLIFEEDIVKINENYPDYSAIGDFYKNQNFVVEYFQPRACYLLKPSEYEDNSGSGIYDLSPDFYEFLQWKPTGKFEENTLQGIEIIGNIHENPELLEAE